MKNIIIFLLLFSSSFALDVFGINVGGSFSDARKVFDAKDMYLERVDENMYVFLLDRIGTIDPQLAFIIVHENTVVKIGFTTEPQKMDDIVFVYDVVSVINDSMFGMPWERIDYQETSWESNGFTSVSEIRDAENPGYFTIYYEVYHYQKFSDYYNWKNGR